MSLTPDVPVHETDVDGIRAFWSPLPGPFRAGLCLRVGTADEPFVVSGITHLLEHLALFGVALAGDHANGAVDQTTTSFHWSSPDPNEAAGFLAAVARQLVDPPLHRLADECQVLRAETATRGRSAEQHLQMWRYGAQGYGVTGLPDLGLNRVDGALLAWWSARYAVRQNAVLWFSGPPPAGLRVTLPDGAPVPPPDPWLTVPLGYPAYVQGGESPFLSALVPLGPQAQALAHVAGARLLEELRTRRAFAYSPFAALRPLTSDTGELVAGSDLVAAHRADGVRAFLSTLSTLGGAGAGAPVTDEEIERWRVSLSRGLAEPEAALDLLLRSATRALLGATPEPLSRQWDQALAVRADDVSALAAQALDTALALVPQETRVVREPWRQAVSPQREPLSGPGYPALGASADAGGTLVVRDDGVTVAHPSGDHLTILREEVVALQAWPDGRRVLTSTTADQLVIEPTLWQGGREAVARIDALVAAHLVVVMPPRGVSEIPVPAAPSPAIAPEAAARPWRRVVARMNRFGTALLVLCLNGYLYVLAGYGYYELRATTGPGDAVADVVVGSLFLAAAITVSVKLMGWWRHSD